MNCSFELRQADLGVRIGKQAGEHMVHITAVVFVGYHLVKHLIPELCHMLMGESSGIAMPQEVIEPVIFVGGFVVEHDVAVRSERRVVDVMRNRLPGYHGILVVGSIHGHLLRGLGWHVSNGKWSGHLGEITKAVGDFDPHSGVVALHGRHSPGIDAVIIGILYNADVIRAAIEAVPDIDAVG